MHKRAPRRHAASSAPASRAKKGSTHVVSRNSRQISTKSTPFEIKHKKQSFNSISKSPLFDTSNAHVTNSKHNKYLHTTIDAPVSLRDLTIEQYNQSRLSGNIPYDSSVFVQGWVRSIRSQGKVQFITINDGSNLHGVQGIIDPEWTSEATLSGLSKYSISAGSSISFNGTLVANPRKDHTDPEGWEIRIKNLVLNGICDIQGGHNAVAVPDAQTTASSSQGKTRKNKNDKKSKNNDNVENSNELQDNTKLTSSSSHVVADGQQQQHIDDKSNKKQDVIQLSPNDPDSYILRPYPMQKKYQTLEYLRNHPDTRHRTNTYAALQRIRSQSIGALHSYFLDNDFVSIHTPVITPSDCEGSGEMFTLALPAEDQPNTTPTSEPVDPITARSKELTGFFGRKAYLNVSGQLYAEIAANSHRRVYSFGPTFRAENSHTSRHLAEFWMLEPEMAFADMDDLMRACESSIQTAISTLLHKPVVRRDLEFFQQRYENGLIDKLERVSTTPFARVTYTKAIDILQKAIQDKSVSFIYNQLKWGDDLQTEHERYLAETIYNSPVFVTNYPASLKSFYMRIDDDSISPSSSLSSSISTSLDAFETYKTTGKLHLGPFNNISNSNQNGMEQQQQQHEDRRTVAAFDLLVPGMGELCGGSQREERVEVLLARMNELGMNISDYQWYIDIRRFGNPKHGGWGMGFERFLAYTTGIDNIRDTVLAPRAPGLLQL